MFEVRVEADFAAAHYLQDYHGKCERLHGHNYRVLAHARGTELDAGGMLLDFTILKKALKDVCNELDHTNLNDNSYFKMNPSAERIAMYQWYFVSKDYRNAQFYLRQAIGIEGGNNKNYLRLYENLNQLLGL